MGSLSNCVLDYTQGIVWVELSAHSPRIVSHYYEMLLIYFLSCLTLIHARITIVDCLFGDMVNVSHHNLQPGLHDFNCQYSLTDTTLAIIFSDCITA